MDTININLIETTIKDRILAYDPEYGAYLWDHLARVSGQLEGFMRFKGYNEQISQQTARAFSLHDAGKILQPLALWQLTEEKPSKEVKDERKKHCFLGPVVLEQVTKGMVLTDEERNHIEKISFFMTHHHERLDGSGPNGVNAEDIDEILRMATIIDEIDGKIKVDGKTIDMIFDEMSGEKHRGKFDTELLKSFKYYAEQSGLFSLPASETGV